MSTAVSTGSSRLVTRSEPFCRLPVEVLQAGARVVAHERTPAVARVLAPPFEEAGHPEVVDEDFTRFPLRGRCHRVSIAAAGSRAISEELGDSEPLQRPLKWLAVLLGEHASEHG